MTKYKYYSRIPVTLLGLISSAAYAQQEGWYLQAGAGASYGIPGSVFDKHSDEGMHEICSQFSAELGYEINWYSNVFESIAFGAELAYLPGKNEHIDTRQIQYPERVGQQKSNAYRAAITSKLYPLNSEKIKVAFLTKLGVDFYNSSFTGTKIGTMTREAEQANERTMHYSPRLDVGAALELTISDKVSIELQAIPLSIPTFSPYATVSIKFNL